MQNRTFLVLLRPIFAQKMKTAPPPKGFGCRSCEGVAVIRPEEQFEFPISAKKAVSILDKPFEFDSRAMKIRVKVAYRCLTLSKKPPLFSKSWLRARGVASFARSGGQRFSPISEAFSGRNFNVFFRPKAGDLQKKKRFSPKSEGFF